MDDPFPVAAAAYLAAVLESADDAIITSDGDDVITSWNAAAASMLGYDRSEIVGQPALMLVPPELRRSAVHAHGRVQHGETLKHFDTALLHRDGTHVDVSLTMSAVRDGRGRTIGISRIARDIGEHKRNELAVHRLAAIVEWSDDAIASKDLNGIVMSWNRAAEGLFGYSAEEMIGRSITTIIPRERLHEEDYVLSRVRAGLPVDHFETVRQRKDGTLVDIALTVSPIRNAAGVVVGASKIARDIGDRKRAEMARLRLAAIVESSDDAIISKDLNGIVTSWNPAAERLFGYTSDEMIGRSITTIIPADRVGEEETVLARIRAGLRVEHFETIRQTKSGQRLDISVAVSPIRDDSGIVVGASKIARDITEQKRLLEAQRRATAAAEAARHEALEAENRRIQEASRVKGAFVANMSHELRTPLNSLIGFAELIADERFGPLPPKYRDFAGTMVKSGRHLLQLINDVLDLAKVESGRIDLRPERVALRALVDETRSTVARLATDRRIEIAIDIDPALTTVHVDPARLKQVLYNYLSNAIKFSPEGGHVLIRGVAENDETFRLDVIDHGIGIAAEDQARLFVDFQQLDSSTNKRYSGTGLGLALTRRIVEAQGGRVGVDSAVGAGSRFWASLPRYALASSAEVAPRDAAAATATP